jgi:hypothetical protein
VPIEPLLAKSRLVDRITVMFVTGWVGRSHPKSTPHQVLISRQRYLHFLVAILLAPPCVHFVHVTVNLCEPRGRGLFASSPAQ